MVSNFVRIALPVLASCGVLSQSLSEGASTHPVGTFSSKTLASSHSSVYTIVDPAVCSPRQRPNQPGREFYTFPNLFLGRGGKPIANYQTLIKTGEQYANYFGVKTVDSQKNFGMPKEDMYAVLVEVNKLVNTQQFDHNPITWKQLPVRLTKAALAVATSKATELGYNLENPAHKADFGYFVKIAAIEEWITGRMVYDHKLAEGLIKGLPIKSGDPLLMSTPSTVCGGFSWYMTMFAKLAGVDNVYKLEGCDKLLDGSANFIHAWNGAILPSGAVVFSDVTRLNAGLFKIGVDPRRGNNSPFNFGIERWQVGFFLFNYHNQRVIEAKRDNSSTIQPKFLTAITANSSTDGIDFFTKQRWSSWYKLKVPSIFSQAYAHY